METAKEGVPPPGRTLRPGHKARHFIHQHLQAYLCLHARESFAQTIVQAEAERERRAKVIHAEGELQAAEKLQHAAAVLSQQPQAIQLRYLETLTVIAADKNSTIVFPLPMDLITPFLEMAKKK